MPGVPAQASPIATAVVVGHSCYIAGQVSLFEEGYRYGTPRQEAERAFELVFLIARDAGFSKADCVYVDSAFSDLRSFREVSGLVGERFDRRPAGTIYQPAGLPHGAKIRVQAVAARG